ncbi:MAG: inositol monophosphatase [Puniceicoccaceae bacterium]
MDKALRHRVNAARIAVQNQVSFFRELFGQVASEWKADETRVTFADYAITEKLFAELRRSFAEDQFISEESVPMDEVVELDSRYVWILDPIDGTNNYALGMAACAISLALLKEGNPVYGLIYDGSTGQLIEGGPGHGIRIDKRKWKPIERTFEERAGIIGMHFPLPENRVDTLAPLMETYRVRSLGSAALQLAYVALGRLDGSLDERVRVWDVAAAVALLGATDRDIRFLSEPPFPLKRLDMQAGYIRYIAGSKEILARLENWLG